MRVLHLSLTDFRNYASAEVALARGPNLFVGRNGQGKTNLVEAIDYIARLSSHRVAGDAPLVRFGADHAVVRAAVVRDGSLARSANYRFHTRLYAVAQQKQTSHFTQVLWARYPFDVINRIDGRALRAAAEHFELLEQIIAGDTDAAMRTTRRHIESGWEELRDWMQHHDYQTVSQMRGAVSRDAAADPSAYERANYIGNITSYTSRFLAAQPIRLQGR